MPAERIPSRRKKGSCTAVHPMSAVPKSGVNPSKRPKIAYPVREETNAGSRASYLKSLRYRISAARIAPPSGALKMAPTPPPIPTAIAIRRSRGESFMMSANIEPNPADICAVGPSQPALPPEEMVIIEESALTNGTRQRIFPSP